MIKSLITTAVSTCALLTATSSFAILPYPCGWYLEGNYGTSHVQGVHVSGAEDGSGNGPGWGINGGYKFMPFFAVELGYTDYATISLDPTDTLLEDGDDDSFAKAKQYSIQLAGKGILPLFTNSGIDVFAKVGIAYLHSKIDYDVEGSTDHSSEGLYVGGGVEYALAHELILNAQWERAYGNSHTGNADLLSVGIALLFP